MTRLRWLLGASLLVAGIVPRAGQARELVQLPEHLSADVASLESREDTAKVALVGGLAVGLASVIYGVASGDTCTSPEVTDPNFGADAAAWGACNDRNMSKMATFGFLGDCRVLRRLSRLPTPISL
jgi:hypothetical protein